MSDDNHQRFDRFVLRAIALLYAAHPQAQLLLPYQLREEPIDESDDEAAIAAEGTINWLYRNGLVTGEDQNGSVTDAQLSTRAYAVLRQTNDFPSETLGQAAVRAAADKGSREEAAVAAVLLKRLS